MRWQGKSATIIGSGGAARAVVYALKEIGVTDLTVMARDPQKGIDLLKRAGGEGSVIPMTAPLPQSSLLVNCTSLGMQGQQPLEVDLGPLPDDAVVYDIVYAPLETPLLRQARERELQTVDGLEMLIGQAALAFDLFFDAPAPRDRDDELRRLLLES